ncbi:hypothetical protein Hypma_000784 [Hypsizygus marmoreus]|uniref:Uncharacterized protein n=1 Tax=Hypsizygus marmoreus TaxID=39966 RepID=A0A369JEY5_HYPMA|nr:hypothetical protein Hypma_000784 [Hypsizygus marmoreus]
MALAQIRQRPRDLLFVPPLGASQKALARPSFPETCCIAQTNLYCEASHQRNEDMGFFSSRKAEDNVNYITTSTNTHEKSVVHVIRSRFYGKNKGKEREGQPPASFTTHGATTAQTLSGPSASTPAHVPRQPSPLSQSSNAAPRGTSAGPSILRVPQDDATSPSRKSMHKTSNIGVQPSPSSSARARSASAGLRHQSSDLVSPTPRQATDTVTVTLAQRLNELAMANSEGLLNDEEYRLLRQNLFERFAAGTAVPTETPVVPIARPHPSMTFEGKPISRPLSNFQVEVNRSPSIRSKSSVTSGVTNFLRRATSRRTPSGSNDYSETSSLFSSTSGTSNIFKRGLSRKTSTSSVRTTTSRNQTDTISISSRHTGAGSERSPVEQSPLFSPSTRSATSIRRLATPPSSFHARGIGSESGSSRYTAFAPDVLDEEHLQTTAQIRQEILAVEAEARRLMDAFNGLEMTTLAKVQRHQGRIPLQENGKLLDSSWAMAPDNRSQRRVVIVDSDAVSMKSATSAGTAPSMARSAHSARKARPKGSLNTLNLTSDWRSVGKIPPVPAIPASYGTLVVGSVSNVSLTRSTGHLAMSSVPEDGQSPTVVPKLEDEETEMEDIRRRREEVGLRYEARLEYLRAKLKGAQLHEKLARK